MSHTAAEHTKGPWETAGNWPHGFSMVCWHDGSGWRPVADCAVSGNAAEANARLIAAAPDLLKACRQALYALKGREHDGFLREAIAKATGEQS